MKSILDPLFAYTPSVATDIRRTFERVRRELDEREDDDADFDAGRGSFWLECNGELVDAASVAIVSTRASAFGIEVDEFICPCCNKLHESLTFC